MGISIQEYFEQKSACQHCVDNHNQEHCTTSLLSSSDKCFFYNVLEMHIGNYSQEERKLARNLRNSIPEEKLVEYYVKSEYLIKKMKLLEMPFYMKYDVLTSINHMYISKIIREMNKPNNEKVFDLIENMLNEIEKIELQGF